MDRINVGLIGFGTVGVGVAKALLEKRAQLERRVGARLVLKLICDKDLNKKRTLKVSKALLTSDVNDILGNPEIDIVVELIGGIHPAKEFILKAIKSGQNVVTANKALLTEEGPEIFDAAQKAGVDLFFEASVGGGIPIIKSLREGLVSNEVDTILGIVNGTSNYILTAMTKEGLSFSDALSDAKLLAPGCQSVAYSYIGPEVTWAIYKNGTIGLAKNDLERAGKNIDSLLKLNGGGRAFIGTTYHQQCNRVIDRARVQYLFQTELLLVHRVGVVDAVLVVLVGHLTQV